MTLSSQERRVPRVATETPKSVPRILEDPARLDAILADPNFAKGYELLATGVTHVYVLPGQKSAWVKPVHQERIAHRIGLAAHLLAGDRGEAVSLAGYKRDRVRAVGFSYGDSALTSRMTIHLPNLIPGYKPAEIIGRLAERAGFHQLLVTSNGGPDERGGRHCHVRVPQMTFRAAHGVLAELLAGIGFALRPRGIEILPTQQCSLLPFGLGGRETFQDPGLEFGSVWTWQSLVAYLDERDPLILGQPRSAPPRRRASGVTAKEPDCAVSSLDPSALATYLQLVAQEGARVFVQPMDLPRSPTGGSEWRASNAALEVAVETHLRISQTELPARLERHIIKAVGLSYVADTVTTRGTIDLDGQHGHNPAEIVARLGDLVGRERLLVTSSSGRRGRYHCHVRLPPMTITAARASVHALFATVGLAEISGGIEVYPSTRNCRIPFGLGGCNLFVDRELEDGVRLPWQDLTARLAALPPLDLSLGGRHVVGARQVHPPQKPSRTPSPAAVNPRVDVDVGAKIERWWRDGVEPGERNDALFALVCDCRRRGLRESEAVQEMQRWIDHGNLQRSNAAQQPGGIAQQRNVFVLDIVERVYAHPPSRRRRAHLTAAEIAGAIELAKTRCGEEAAKAVVVLLDVLPWFKGAWLDGRDEVRLHRDVWSRTLGRRGAGYAEVRDALGLFTCSAPHMVNECAKTWRLLLSFPFEQTEPARALVPNRPRGRWKAAWILADAERVVARAKRVAERKRRCIKNHE